MTSTTIELSSRQLCFAAGHFTIFSACSRERLHGHNYRVKAFVTTHIHSLGISFDYDILVEQLLALCQGLDRYVLLPGESTVLCIKEKLPFYEVTFNHETMFFLQSDTRIMPLRNITIEELAQWFLMQLITAENPLKSSIQKLVIKVSNGEGRWARADWVTKET